MEFIFSKETPVKVILDSQADSGIRRVWEKVSKDICSVTGTVCRDSLEGEACAQAVLVGTSGQELAARLEGRVPELKNLRGKWESYWFGLLDAPAEGVEKGIVIVGSDKLGTIYGMFRLSELLGVTAWGFWGDVAPPCCERAVFTEDAARENTGDAEKASKETVRDTQKGVRMVTVRNGMSREPSVKFRGFFINDEWPCFGNWTTSHFQGFNAEMYDHIFEYLLRMKGNYLWPAMWSSNFLLDGPGLASMELATEYGIYIGMSHHEPCMRSGEEFTLMKGEDSPYGTEWDYAANRDGLLRFWADSLKRVKGQQVFPTVGMRGERDSKMLGEDSTIDDNVRLLKEIIRKQRELIRQHLDADDVPQLFAIYKEVEDYYFGNGGMEGIRGYEELEDVTLLFCDDNFGNMRALPQAQEWGHPGGFGMYYHLDYHGSPISYEWVNSTPVTRVWEQMTEAYEYGVRTLWIVNVGDVKFQEYSLGYFMELAYDMDTWGKAGCDAARAYTGYWLKKMFGSYADGEQLADMAWVLEESVRLHGLRRAESLNDTVYHPAHYLETKKMLERADALERENERLRKTLAGSPAQSGYFSMIYFPAAAIANLIKMHLFAGLNHLYAAQGRAAANVYGEKLQACIERDAALKKEMAEFSSGKWKGMEMASHIGFVNWNDEDWRYPVRHEITLPGQPRLVVSRADETKTYTNQYFPIPLEIDDFLCAGTEEVLLQIANGGEGEVCWEIPERSDYLSFSAYQGRAAVMDEIAVRVLWDKVDSYEPMEFTCHVRTKRETVPVCIRVRKQDLSRVPEGAFVMQNGLCVLNASDFARSIPGNFSGREAAFRILEDYGKYGSGMKVFPSTAVFSEDEIAGAAPGLTYEIWAQEECGGVLELHTSPANPLIYGGSLRVGVSVGEEPARILDITGENYRGGDGACPKWADAVLNQEHVAGLPVKLRQGLNRITLWAQDAGIVLERMIIYKCGAKKKDAYLGPGRSYQKIV